MARVLGRAELDVNWRLVFSSSSTPLRKNGFYAGYATLEELQAECQNLSYSAMSESFAVPMEIDSGSEATKALLHSNQDSDSTAQDSNPAVALEMATDGDEVDEDVVEDFYIFDETDEFVSLAELPLESEEAVKKFYVQGKTDGGLRPTMFPINAWRVEYGRRPILFVRMSKSQGKWAELGQPLKIYASGTLRSLLVVLNLLNFVKKNLLASQKAIWEYVRKACSYPEVEASEGDVLENLATMRKLVRQDCELGTALVIQDLLRERREIAEPSSRKRARLVVEPDEEFEEEDGDLGDSICAICDDGGDLLCCDGPCLRSFHGTKSAAAESSSQCSSLCLSDLIVKQTMKYFCRNCAHNQHQCFECGELGISEGPSQEVFLCDVALCGRFYHLSCVSKLLKSEASAKGFACSLHRCFECHEGEKESSRLYPCRRCPRAWHRQCAKGIKFNDEDAGGEIRGWNVGRARFLYCMQHKLVPHLGTPQRNHLKFPGELTTIAVSKNQVQSDGRDFDSISKGQLSSKGLALDNVQHANKIKHRSKAISSRPSPVKVPAPKNQLNQEAAVRGQVSYVERMPVFPKEEVDDQVLAMISNVKPISPETLAAKLTIPSTVGVSTNKNIQIGKVESLLRAVAKACDCLRDGGTIEQAQSIFPCHHLKLFENSKESLKVYMSPLLHGMRYSSYGRHFTQNDKLQTIVERLHWYVNSGDMVADLCCGANTFSRLMFKKLTEMNKSCCFKNYDIIQPNDTFNFKRKDYTTITKEELCPGDQLVIGLNPPFGVKGQTASKFAEYAAAFEPKIIILIAPKETRRLEKNGYELIWADNNLLKGDAFYLPGSVDKEGKTINQENLVPPVLSLWSRGSWAVKHRRIALEQGHLRLWSENNGPSQCNNSTLGEEKEALQHMDQRESFNEPNSVQDVLTPTQTNLVGGGSRMNFASEDILPTSFIDTLEDVSVEDVEMDVCMEAGEEVGVPEVFLKKPPLYFCNSLPRECTQEHIVNTTKVMAEGATPGSKQDIQYSPKQLPFSPKVDATSTFQSDQGSKSLVADCSSMILRVERKETAETQGIDSNHQKGKASKDHSDKKTMSRLTDEPASHRKRERSPRNSSTQERSPRKSSTQERAPRKSSTQERSPLKSSTQERSPRKSSTQERSPRKSSTQEVSPRTAGNISRKRARRFRYDRRGQAEYYRTDRHDTYTRSNLEYAAWNSAANDSPNYQPEYISELDEGARRSDDGVSRRPWNLSVNVRSHRHRQVSYEPVVNNVGCFYGERPYLHVPPRPPPFPPPPSLPPPPPPPHLGFNACYAREDGLLPSRQLYGYPGYNMQARQYPSQYGYR